jgi:ubiquinone/menaquinone biosynthesis C-methylase UbiE
MNARRSLAELRRDWTTLGEADPLWAVCVDPARRGGGWDLDEFLATGRAEIAGAMSELDRHGSCARRDSALDFGCGVGRLTSALSRHFGTVTGVDISPSMLEHARRILASDPGCRVVLGDGPDLAGFGDDSFDLVYSSLVLQHIAPGLADAYLAEFVRVTRPGGAIVLVVPEAHLRTPRGLVYAYAPHSVIAWLQRTVFGYPAPMRMYEFPASRVRRVVEPRGARLVASLPHPISGSHWRMARHFVSVTRPPAREAGAPSETSGGGGL